MAQFLTPVSHFEALVALLPPEELNLYRSLVNSRPEAAFRGRNFVVYQITGREPDVLDNITILDFHSDDTSGASCEVRSKASDKTVEVAYGPRRMFGFPIFMHLPLHGKLRWSTTENDTQGGSLAFDIIVRTQSRLHLRERGVVYCEPGVGFAKEFQGLKS